MTSTDHATLQPAAPLPDRRIPTVRKIHQLISRFLPDFLRLAEPDAAIRMGLGSCTVLPAAGDQTNIVFAQVSTSLGEEVTVIVAIEPEALPPAEIAQKLGAFLLQCELTYGNPVLLTVLYLSGGRAGLHLESAQIGTFGDIDCVRLFFTAWGLAESNADYYLSRPEPLAWALVPYMRSISRTQQEVLEAARARSEKAELSEDDCTALLRFLS
jgi:hypothetical protein